MNIPDARKSFVLNYLGPDVHVYLMPARQRGPQANHRPIFDYHTNWHKWIPTKPVRHLLQNESRIKPLLFE